MILPATELCGSSAQVRKSRQARFLSRRAKKILELALREALALGHDYIGTEHILLGLLHENEGVATRVLLEFDADSEKIRMEVIRVLSGPEGSQYSASANAEMAAIARRGIATSMRTASVGVDDFRFVVHPDDELRRLLMAAAPIRPARSATVCPGRGRG